MSGMTVLFTCHKCGLQRVRVEVPLRTEGQDIVEWTQQTAQYCGDRHALLSPKCDEGKLDLIIPLPKNETDAIGVSAPPVPDMSNSDLLKSKGAN
jgi:hypothetical protein